MCTKDHDIQIREIRLSAGAEFIVAIAGDIMTMPGLPKNRGLMRFELGLMEIFKDYFKDSL